VSEATFFPLLPLKGREKERPYKPTTLN